MVARIAFGAACLILPLVSQVAQARCNCGILDRLHHHGCHECCELHIHYCEPGGEAARRPEDSAAVGGGQTPLTYTQILPSAPAFSMPFSAMPMMPMVMPFPVAQQQAQMRQTNDCGPCEPRIERLETGVKNLSTRMDKIEEILVNQNRALQGIRDALKEGGLIKDE